MVALMITIWRTVNEKLGSTCSSSYDYGRSCTCKDGPEDRWTMGKAKQVDNSVSPTAR